MGFSAVAVVLDDEVWELATEMADSALQERYPIRGKSRFQLCVFVLSDGLKWRDESLVR